MYTNMTAGYQAYQKNKYETASPHKLILMLYYGALKYTNQAETALAEGNPLSAHQHILKVQDIIYELIACLNEREGGEVAQNLKNLYLYVIDQLVQANIQKSAQPLREAKAVIQSVKDAWETIGKDVTAGQNYA
ncbi:flagellar export chaperone FliS [Paenibacillus thiaminolyticus]|uniref:flagellar export chaperone FliS n=1 Tax=Paenibacillus thiaminolyticus TaxID=49283 RepID=UPI001165AF62|nr:flagellar export chaperone FliS [Paenibacillus thiaminolyticus]NGP58753.1 flagellar export chaperone FliS [Paenibacillus thiaminolyticus]WCR26225.1 flagellar export chaperone FliS [Paenibacillus thiaminolyticus]